MYKTASFLLAVLTASVLLPAQPVDIPNLGRIDFPTSGTPQARRYFIRGVLYLHSFEFEDAAEEFRLAQQVEPGFAMAYWGEAMSYNHPLWRQVDVKAARGVLQRLGKTEEERLAKAPTQREKDFIASLTPLFGEGAKAERDAAFSAALGKMYAKYPDDHEVACFYALSILGLTDGERDFRNYMKAASIVEEVFAENPRHPGAAHYLIHSYDDPIHAPLGLRAARVYAQIAPAASHAQHMISHIHVALGRWDEAVAANEKAWAVSEQRVKKKNLGVEQLDFHSFSWLHYAYLQQGRYRQAHSMLETVEDAHRQNPRVSYSRMRAHQVIESRRTDLELPPSTGNFQDIFVDALMALNGGHVGEAKKLTSEMPVNSAAAKVMKKQLEGMLALKEEQTEVALRLFREAASMEDELPLSYGPPLPNKPAYELLGELLLKMGKAGQAVTAFEHALQRAPRRALSLLGLARAYKEVGDAAASRQTYAELAEVWDRADPDLPELKEIHQAAGRQQ